MSNYLILGQWNAICDICGQKKKSSELRKNWEGLMVCESDWEVRHPQELIRVRGERVATPWSRSEPTDVFIENASAFGSSTINDEEINGFVING